MLFTRDIVHLNHLPYHASVVLNSGIIQLRRVFNSSLPLPSEPMWCEQEEARNKMNTSFGVVGIPH